MRYCPECRTEYLDEVTHCADCGAELVKQRPPEEQASDVQWVHLASLSNEVQGNLLKEELEKRGIRTLLKKDVFMSGFGNQGTNLFVDEASLPLAQQIHEEVIGPGPS